MNTKTILRFAFPILALGAFAMNPLTAQTSPTTEPSGGEKIVTPSGLTIIKIAPGTGAKPGDTVQVHYTGKHADGSTFDSSVGREPISFKLGTGGVIKGWDEGIAGMQIGEKRHLSIPPDLAYGPKGRGPIKPNETLEFDVELVGIMHE